MFDDISFLVQETLKEAESTREDKGFIANFFTDGSEELPEEVPGFFYHLQKKSSTFVIRIHPSENLKEDYQNILDHPDLFPTLRLTEEDRNIKDILNFFECDRFELAKTIKDILGNKRFPIFEEHIFNVSDPGDCWWIKCEETRMTVLFKLSYTEDLTKLIKIGPLGDPQKTMSILSQLYGYFKLIFPVADYSCGHGQWSISTSEAGNKNFEYLKKIFEEGETSYDFWEFLRQLEFNSMDKSFLPSLQKANYFLMELSCIREFWKLIESKL